MDLLARREHARLELVRKLKKKGFDDTLLNQALDSLESDGLLNEQRFTEAFIKSRVDRGQGPLRIRVELKQRGINDIVVDQMLSELDIDWSAVAHAVWSKKFDEPPSDLKTRAKQQRFLAYRGFSADHLRSIFT